MDNASPPVPSSEQTAWTRSIVSVDLDQVQVLYAARPELLWVALDEDETRVASNHAPLIAQLEQVQVLGPTLTRLSAIPFTILDNLESDESLPPSASQQQRASLLDFLLQQATSDDLNQQTWGAGNTTLHLACFLNQPRLAERLIRQGASFSIQNEFGHAPKDVAPDLLVWPDPKKKNAGRSLRPNYANPDRFKQLRALAESQEDLTEHLDTRKKEKSNDDLRHKARRQQDLALLSQRSAVKNNPLFRKLEEQQQQNQQQKPGPVRPPKSSLRVPDLNDPRRNSKVISSLKTKTIVSSSVFRQGESTKQDASDKNTSNIPAPTIAEDVIIEKDDDNNDDNNDDNDDDDDNDDRKDDGAKKDDDPREHADDKYDDGGDENVTTIHVPPVVVKTAEEEADDRPATDKATATTTTTNTTTDAAPVHDSTDSAYEDDGLTSDAAPRTSEAGLIVDATAQTKEATHDSSNTMDRVGQFADQEEEEVGEAPLTGRDRESSLSLDHRMSQQSEGSEMWFDSSDSWIEAADGKRISIRPPPRRSMLSQSSVPAQLSSPPPPPTEEEEEGGHSEEPAYRPSSAATNRFVDVPDAIHEPSSSSVLPGGTASVDPAEHEELRQVREEHETRSSDEVSRPASSSFSPQQRRSIGGESVDTWPPPSPTLPPLPNDTKIEEYNTARQSEYGHVHIETTSRYVVKHNLENLRSSTEEDPASEPAITSPASPAHFDHDVPEEEDYGTSKILTDQQPDIQLSLPEPSGQRPPSNVQSSVFGKLYLRISCAQDLLLPLPKQTTYARCVVSDGQYEYMSRFEVLGQKIMFDYECVVDTLPDMIITVAIHVKPDPHVRPKTGLSRWLTSARKQREMLPAYVHPEDGAIGQARFALEHMLPACYQKSYATEFDCFNSWYLKPRRKDQAEVLKVVGSLSVEMLYLSVTDPSSPIPKSLRECDLAIRIRQWHETCWHSGYLSTRPQGAKFWDRQYCRLIGSQLIAYASKEASSWKPLGRHDIADAIRLSAASDQVIVTLVDLPKDGRVFQDETITEETGRGFFRITFPDFYIDCVSDHPFESEEWVKILKSMIGRVPLKVPFLLS